MRAGIEPARKMVHPSPPQAVGAFRTFFVKGSVKETIGGATGDRDLEAEGQADRASGNVQEGFGEAKRKVGDAIKSVGDAIRK